MGGLFDCQGLWPSEQQAVQTYLRLLDRSLRLRPDINTTPPTPPTNQPGRQNNKHDNKKQQEQQQDRMFRIDRMRANDKGFCRHPVNPANPVSCCCCFLVFLVLSLPVGVVLLVADLGARTSKHASRCLRYRRHIATRCASSSRGPSQQLSPGDQQPEAPAAYFDKQPA